MASTILAIGAHYDDCIFGVPGILLKAVRKNHRVVILSLIGDYSNWRQAKDRPREIVEQTTLISREFGVEARFLNFAQMSFDVTAETKRQVAEAIAEINPTIAFMLWPHDRHPDHEAASRLSKIGLGFADRLLPPDRKYSPPRRIYQYDNGPRHTIGFEPDTFVDVTDEWPQAMQWLGKLMAMVRNESYDPNKMDPAQRTKESIALYRGSTCGVRYAEAVRGVVAYPSDVFGV